MEKYKILIVEDDKTLSSVLKYNLEVEGAKVDCAATAAKAGGLLASGKYDLAVMDVNLPDGNGFDLCGKFRKKSDAPVIFLTANDMEADMLRGYELGADDYVTKPFSLNVFLKKVRAFLKRLHKQTDNVYSDGFLEADLSKMDVRAGGESISLTPLEFRLLETFIENPGIVLTRSALMRKLWDMEGSYADEHALTSSMSRLRKKIEKTGHSYIKTIYGMGYMWKGPEDG